MLTAKYLALDTETGGRTVKQTLLTGYFAVMTEDKQIIAELSLKLKPRAGSGYVCDVQALQHNGIDLAEHDKVAIPLEEGVRLLAEFLAPYTGENKLVPLGQNISFDLKFLYEYLIERHKWLEHCTEEVADTFVIAKRLKKEGKLHVNAMKLGVLCAHLGVPLMNAHSEKDDTIAAAYLHTRLMQLDVQPKSKVKGLPAHSEPPPTPTAPAPFDGPIPLLKAISGYSILRSPASVDDYIEKAVKMGSPCVSVNDLGYAIGCLELWTKAKDKKIVGIPSTTVYVADGPSSYELTLWATNEAGYKNILKISTLSWSKTRIDGKQRRQDTGLGAVPRVSLSELTSLLDGIAVGTGGVDGLLGRKSGEDIDSVLMQLKNSAAAVYLEICPRPLTHRFDPSAGGFTEISDEEGNSKDLQAAVNNTAITLSGVSGVPLLLVVDANYVDPDDRDAREMLVSSLDLTGGLASHRSLHVPSTEEAWAYFHSMHGDGSSQAFVEGILGAYQLSELCKDIKITAVYRLPVTELPEDIRAVAADHREGLKMLMMRKIDEHGRMKWDDEAWTKRLSWEMEVICDNGVQDFSEYFTFLEYWNGWTRKHSILSAPGRGSGAGSLLCYLLKITHLDPFRHRLPFSRFLSPGRVKRKKFPDIDWDMGDRDPLLAKLAETYGDKFSGCSTHGKLKVKSAIKDAFKALQIRPLEARIDAMERGNIRDLAIQNLEEMKEKVEQITKPIPNTPMGMSDYDFLIGYTDKEGNEHPGYLWQDEHLQEFFEEYRSEEPSKDLKNMVERLLGIPRSIGRHASAYFVSNAPIQENAPLFEIGGETVTQYTAPTQGFNSAESSGLIKFDFLGVNTLLDISNCVRLVHKSLGYKTWLEEFTFNGEKFKLWQGDLLVEQVPGPDGTIHDIYNLPEDPEVCRDSSEGRTEAVFQLKSPLMTGYAKRIKLEKQDDYSIMVAIIRTGPLEAETEQDNPDKPLSENGKPVLDANGKQLYKKLTMTDAYVYRKHGKVPVTYAHPDMEPILGDTYGVAVYQEQLQEMFSALAGYSEEEADYIRELISKKKLSDMEKIIPELKQRLKDRGWTEEQTDVFVGLCISSAKYSFNRAHSASYGTVAYICAWLKHHYPKEWWTAVLQNCKIEDIRNEGYDRALREILVSPHVNGPMETFEPRDDGKVHAPIWLIDGIGDAAAKVIREARETMAKRYVEAGLSKEDAEKASEFASLQEFFERTQSLAVNEGVFKRLIIVGGFQHIEPDKTPKELMLEYMKLKKVSKLVVGEGKTGDELKAAADAWYEKSKDKLPKDFQESMGQMEMDSVEIQIKRMELLPIYRNDVHENFRELLGKYISHHDLGTDTYRTRDKFGHPQQLTVLRDGKQIASFYEKHKIDRYKEAVWVGLMESKEDLDYADKKQEGKQVRALKMKVVNSGDAVECILWPNALEMLDKMGRKPPDGKKILLCVGPVKPSRQPGMWSMSVNKMVEI